MLVHLLCGIHEEPLPEELDQLRDSKSTEKHETDTGNESDGGSEENANEDEDEEFESGDECDDDDDDEMFKMDVTPSSSATVSRKLFSCFR